MPPAATTRGLEAGERAEVRVAQAWFWDGYYVRRGIDLQHRFGAEVSTVTDLDVLGYAFDLSCLFRKQVGEVKTGKSSSAPRPLDRALWLKGVGELVSAQSGEVTTAFKTSATIRDACRRLGVTVQHLDDLANREKRLNIAAVEDVGAQGATVALMRNRIAKFVKADPVLERAWWFLVSEVWFLEPFDALKRTLGVIRQLGQSWPPDKHVEATEAFRWFFAESTSIATLHLSVIAGGANSMDASTFQETARARLATGDLPYFGVKKLSEQVDVFVGKILHGLNAPAEIVTSTIGAFEPTPPDYTEPLLELISRLAADAAGTATLPRQMDAIVFERLVHRRNVSHAVLTRLNPTSSSERLLRLVGAFLSGQFAVPDPVHKALMAPLDDATLSASAETSPPPTENGAPAARGAPAAEGATTIGASAAPSASADEVVVPDHASADEGLFDAQGPPNQA